MKFSFLYLRALQGPVGIQEPWDHLECLYVRPRTLLEAEMWDCERSDRVAVWTGLSVDVCTNQPSVCACQGLKGERGSPGNSGQKGESVSRPCTTAEECSLCLTQHCSPFCRGVLEVLGTQDSLARRSVFHYRHKKKSTSSSCFQEKCNWLWVFL